MRVHNLKKGVIADINMIPLIDVSLILLIIFMVITPFLVQSQIQVSLPKASEASKGSDENVITVQLASDGAVTVEGKTVRFDRLEKELTLRLSKSRNKTVLVQADRKVSIERVVTALDTAKRLGANKVGIGVDPLEK
ncbi:MAG TPA: biopolymer transporter ExbD [Elusimicrobiales bacterium]|nr:biopolymer transporter ExbD [Elusimicrobiales bacterium]